MDNYTESKKPKDCPGVHEWIYVAEGDTERLKCKNCNKYPGVDYGRTESEY